MTYHLFSGDPGRWERSVLSSKRRLSPHTASRYEVVLAINSMRPLMSCMRGSASLDIQREAD